MNINNITSLNLNKKKKNTNYSINSIESCDFKTVTYLKDYYLNQISFGTKYTANQIIARLGEGNFPSPEIVKKLKDIGESKDYSLYDIHTERYNEILDCQSLKEAKEKYPEFQDVIDAKDIDTNVLERRHTLRKIADNRIEGIKIEDLSLELLKRNYGKLINTDRKAEYWDISRGTIFALADMLNIKLLNKTYFFTVTSNSKEAKAKTSAAMKKLWKNPDSVFHTDEYKAKVSASLTESHKDPNSGFNDPKTREKISNSVAELWQDPDSVYKSPECRAKKSASLVESHKDPNSGFNSPECNAKRSQAMTKLRQNPNSKYNTQEFKDKRSLIMIILRSDPDSVYNSPEYRAKLSASLSEAHKDPDSTFNSPEYRAKLSASLSEARKDPNSKYNTQEYRENRSQLTQEQWQNPEFRDKMEKVYEACRIAYDLHPEITDMLSSVADEFPLLGKILDKLRAKKELNDAEKAYRLAYFRECDKRMPGYKNIIGDEQHKILVEWGVMEE